jgi:hypothetical protein
VALDVGFVDHVHPELVAQVVEDGVIGVVARADGGDVVRPHGLQIGAHVVYGDGLAPVGVVVVAVDTEDPDRPAVDEQLPIDDLDPAQADSLCRGLGQAAVGVEHRTSPHRGWALRQTTPRPQARTSERARCDR